MINRVIIWGTRRSGTTYLQDLFCHELNITEHDRMRFSECFGYDHYVKFTNQVAPNLTPNKKTFTAEWLPAMINEIKYREFCVIKTHFDNLHNIPKESLNFLFKNYTNIILYREDWWEQVTSHALAHHTDNWHNRPGLGVPNTDPVTIDKKTWIWCQDRLKKSYMQQVFDINLIKDRRIISYEDMINSMVQQGHIFGMSKSTHLKMQDKKTIIKNYDEVRSWRTKDFKTQWFKLKDGRVILNEN